MLEAVRFDQADEHCFASGLAAQSSKLCTLSRLDPSLAPPDRKLTRDVFGRLCGPRLRASLRALGDVDAQFEQVVCARVAAAQAAVQVQHC